MDRVNLEAGQRVLRKGYYPTKGGHYARLDTDITTTGIGVVPGA